MSPKVPGPTQHHRVFCNDNVKDQGLRVPNESHNSTRPILPSYLGHEARCRRPWQETAGTSIPSPVGSWRDYGLFSKPLAFGSLRVSGIGKSRHILNRPFQQSAKGKEKGAGVRGRVTKQPCMTCMEGSGSISSLEWTCEPRLRASPALLEIVAELGASCARMRMLAAPCLHACQVACSHPRTPGSYIAGYS